MYYRRAVNNSCCLFNKMDMVQMCVTHEFFEIGRDRIDVGLELELRRKHKELFLLLDNGNGTEAGKIKQIDLWFLCMYVV